MRKFAATMTYELHPETAPDARKLLRAELVGRRWQDRCKGRALPSNCVWIHRSVQERDTTSTIHDACVAELRAAVLAVAASGRPIRVLRAWVQVSGGGTYGLAAKDAFSTEAFVAGRNDGQMTP